MLPHPLEKNHLSWRCFHLSPGLSHLPAHLKCASEWYRWMRYSSYVCLTSFSKMLFYCFQQTRLRKHFSNRLSFFAWQFQVRLHMMPVVLMETACKISFWPPFRASEKFFIFCGVIGMLCL